MMNNVKTASLNEAFVYIEKALQAKLDSASFPDHPVAKGDVSEDAWRDLLRRYLPSRYSIESGFVIDAHNNTSNQIDCIVYDNFLTPTFWGERGYLYIPSEAVHAVFEIKPQVNKKYLRQASQKVESVRVLYRTSASFTGSGKEEPPKPLFHIIGGLLATKSVYRKKLDSPQFYRAIDELQKNGSTKKNIDVVITAFDGYADYFDTGFPADKPRVDLEAGAATRGLFRLVRALIIQGTVGAIDLGYYEGTVGAIDFPNDGAFFLTTRGTPIVS